MLGLLFRSDEPTAEGAAMFRPVCVLSQFCRKRIRILTMRVCELVHTPKKKIFGEVARACSRFFGWCEQRGLALAAIRPFDVAAYIEGLQQEHSAPGVKQQLAAVRMPAT
jgi:hypothetical protein